MEAAVGLELATRSVAVSATCTWQGGRTVRSGVRSRVWVGVRAGVRVT